MADYSIRVISADGRVKGADAAPGFASLVFTEEYQPGDRIVITPPSGSHHVWLQVDEVLGSSLVYLTGELVYTIPFDQLRLNLPPKAFTGDRHYLFIREAYPDQVRQYRNLAVNVSDQHNAVHLYPHASANVETRGEAVFFACNAIDGICENRNHGTWPYQSWGINRQADAQLTVDFGREVEVDKIVMFIRADFPHDSWWTQATLRFSDGTDLIWPLEKDRFGQVLTFPKKQIRWVSIGALIKADDPSPFPALTQLEVYGTELPEGG